MSDYDVTNINIRVGRPAPRRRGGGRPPKCTFNCAFCEGTGIKPGSVYTEPCRVCKGKGTITLDVSCNKLMDCAFCEGTGIKPGSVYTEPCPVCHGHGKVER